MDESTYVTEVSVIAEEAFSVLDAAVGRWIALEFVAYSDLGSLGMRWLATSSGSSHHTLIRDGRPIWHINLRSISSSKTVVQLVVLRGLPSENLYGQLAAFWEWFGQQQLQIKQLPPIDQGHTRHADRRIFTTDPTGRKRRGPAPAPHNEWARAKVRQGKSIDELLPEYMERRGENYDDEEARKRAHEALRKTIERAQK